MMLRFSFRLPWQPELCMECILLAILGEGHPMIIPAKLHQVGPSGLGEEVV